MALGQEVPEVHRGVQGRSTGDASLGCVVMDDGRKRLHVAAVQVPEMPPDALSDTAGAWDGCRLTPFEEEAARRQSSMVG